MDGVTHNMVMEVTILDIIMDITMVIGMDIMLAEAITLVEVIILIMGILIMEVLIMDLEAGVEVVMVKEEAIVEVRL